MSITAEIIKDFRFEAAHFLPHAPEGHQCRRMHGHSYKLTIRAMGPIDEKTGWVMDLADLSAAFAPIAKLLDHRLLNEIDGLENPTGENVALWIFRRLEIILPQISSITLKATKRIAVTIHKNHQNS